MYEHKTQPVISDAHFVRRMLHSLRKVMVIAAVSLAVGVLGYHFTEGMPWLDALLNASMILGGMGPVDALHSKLGKLFASIYALYSGLFLIALMGILLAPVIHRVMHKFHAPREEV